MGPRDHKAVTLIERITGVWKEDNLLRRVVKNSSYLFSAAVVSSVLSFIQTIIATRLIGLENWGLVSIIQTFANNINRFLSFRMSEVVLKHLGPALEEDKKQEGAVYVKAAGLIEAGTSVLAFLLVLLLAPWAARTWPHDPRFTPLFAFYGLILLSNLVFETSTGVLQATHRFNKLARGNLAQSIITITVIGAAYVIFRWVSPAIGPYLLFAVLMAYVLGKTYYAVSLAIAAGRSLNEHLGKGWWRVPLSSLPDWRGLVAFAINTNLNGTVNLIFRDNIPLYLARFVSLADVGLFKIAGTLLLPITLILDPFIAPTYAEISRTIVKRQWDITLRLLRRITAIGTGIVLALWAGWAALGWWLIPLLYKAQARPAYPILLILIAGYGFAGIFQWNRSLFLSIGKPGYPLLISILTGVIELALIAVLVPRFGNVGMAAILSGYFIVSIGFISLRGVLEIRRRERQEAAQA
jgi:O-antigen/teichoic acid export membrane protein